MTAAPRPVVLAAGGTGGHVFPAESLAGELARRGVPLALVTDDRGRQWQGALAELPVHRVRAASPSAGGLANRARNVLSLGIGIAQSMALLGRLAPTAVVGFGGYACVPAMLAARLRRLPTLIHEQNAVLGRANRLVAGRGTTIATAFAAVRHLAGRDPRVRLVGNPVRDAVRALRDVPYVPPSQDGDIRMVVIGGSQGAASLGVVIPDAIAALPDAIRNRLKLAQQCRAEDLERVRAFYAARGIAAECQPFFADFPARLAGAHLVVARAGASTVAELTTSGRPSVLVPFPHATEDHQRANAKAVDEVGASILLPHERFTADALREHLETLFGAPERLATMAAAARAAGHPDAARDLADLVIKLIGHAHCRPERNEGPCGGSNIPSSRAQRGISREGRLHSQEIPRCARDDGLAAVPQGPSLCSGRQGGAAA